MHSLAQVRRRLSASIRHPKLRQAAIRTYRKLIFARLVAGCTVQGTTLTGRVDLVDVGWIRGWAADLRDLRKPLGIEVWAGERLLAATTAGEYREDLREVGFGGAHGFTVLLPPAEEVRPFDVHVKVAGRDARLEYKRQPVFPVEPAPIRFIAADVVNNCNLRCPFCVVDYSATSTTELMSEETFTRLVRLIRSVPNEGFWLSCLHEPTLHPRLNDLIDLIPRDCRHKVWFTTNLARPLSDDVFRHWARSGMHHINVSLDTMNAELFAVLRKFGRYKVFKDNLDRLTAIFKEHPEAPKLRYITLAFRSNLHEIPGIVAHCHEHWLSTMNEIRYTFNMEHITDDFRREHYLDKKDWPALSARLAALPYKYEIAYPPEDGYEETIQPSANYFELGTHLPTGASAPTFNRPLELRARPDGTVVVVGKETLFSVKLGDLEDPAAFFRGL